jgi:hypothetical protein
MDSSDMYIFSDEFETSTPKRTPEITNSRRKCKDCEELKRTYTHLTESLDLIKNLRKGNQNLKEELKILTSGKKTVRIPVSRDCQVTS